jgi:hypothetical protein
VTSREWHNAREKPESAATPGVNPDADHPGNRYRRANATPPALSMHKQALDGRGNMKERRPDASQAVIPADAGIHVAVAKSKMDSGLRRNDECWRFFEVPMSGNQVRPA